MTRSAIIRMALVFLALMMLHYTVRPALHWRASIDFVLIAILIVAVRSRPGAAAVLGFLVGLMVDVQEPATLGSSALGLAFVGFGASYLKASFFSEKPAMNVLLFFLGKWLYDLVFVLAEGRFEGSSTLAQLLLWSPVAAVLTSAAGALILGLSSPFMRVSDR
jgi:rod shape-determining protein MreD